MKKSITQIIKKSNKNILGYIKLMLYIAFYLCFVTTNSFAQNLVNKYKTDLKEIENYLNNIKYLSANFIQESPDKKLVEGNFYLSRPGKMRVEYNAKPKILIIVNGSVLSYIDTELDETSYLRTNTTPASFLTRKNISFNAKDVKVTNIKKEKKAIHISLIKKNSQNNTELTISFQKNPLKFSKMEVKNEVGEKTSITLSNINFRKKLDNSLFITNKEDSDDELY